jgi:hypothetical protein
MKAASLILAVILGAAAGEGVDYRVTLGYHASLLKNREWSISVYRAEKKIHIEIDNYENRTRRGRLANDEYMRLVDFLNRKGVWRLKGNFPEQSPNAFYLIEVESGKYKNSFRVEAGPLLSGGDSRYREIIRRLENLARLELND